MVIGLQAASGMHVSPRLAYDNFAAMRNFSGFTRHKFPCLCLGVPTNRFVTILSRLLVGPFAFDSLISLDMKMFPWLLNFQFYSTFFTRKML